MSTRSMFDSNDVPDASNHAERMQIVYDDDLFTFGSVTPNGQSDAGPQNVSISLTINQNDEARPKNGKRKARQFSELENGRIFKSAKPNITTIKVVANDRCRRVINTNTKSEEYELLNKIGSGTYGDVYKARWKVTDEIIAIKRLKCKLTVPNSKKNMAFMKREYDHLCEMQQFEHIIRLLKGREYQISKDDLQIDLLFEYCPYDLKKLIKHTRITFHLNDIKTFLRQMLLGLDYMHRKMIMHRDFKTENILLTADGVVKIADFGLTRRFSDPIASLERQIYTPNVVTQWYRAPEILFGDTQYDQSVDIWGVGCVMGEFWNRQPILQGNNEINQILLISKLCGAITPDVWPDVVHLPVFQKLEKLPDDKRITRTYLKHKTPILTHDQANDFFDKLLRCNPEKRLSASTALNDRFFFTAPLPSKNLKKFMKRILPVLNSNATTKSVVTNPAFTYVY